MTKIQAWLKAFRLRTLPLAFSSILMGSFLAFREGFFLPDVFLLTLSTTLFLQILSNLANDYGDFIKGTDNNFRVGPGRTLQTGLISLADMKSAIILCTVLSFISGIALLYYSGAFSDFKILSFFLILGILCIAAAIMYTVGKNAYGYKGLGDISVFLFFGLAGVLGTHFLMSKTLPVLNILPAFTCGLLAAGVLNLNNLRDIDNDKASGKRSIPVQIGYDAGKIYQNALVVSALMCLLLYLLINFSNYKQLLPLLLLPVYVLHLLRVNRTQVKKDLDPFLKQLALLSLFTSLLFGLSLII